MALEKEVYYRGIDTNLDFFDFAETLFRYNNVASVIQEINSSKGSAGYKLYDKAKKFIKEIFQPRFINIVEEEGIDGQTLVNWLSLSACKVDSQAHDCIDRLYGQNFCSNIGFITKDEPLGNAQCYTIFFINGVYHNTHLGRSVITRSSEDLGNLYVNICPVPVMYLPRANALAYNTRRGFAGIQSWQRCLQSEDSVARYCSVEKAYRAFESEIADYITDTQRSYSLGKMLSDASRIKVAKMLAGAKVL